MTGENVLMPEELTEAQQTFITRALAGADYASEKWVDADTSIQLRDAWELGVALHEQGLDGANAKAEEIEARKPSLQRIAK